MAARPRGVRSALFRCGAMAAEYRWTVLLVWGLLGLASLALLPSLLGALGAPPLSVRDAESARTTTALRRDMPVLGSEQMMLVFHSDRLTAGTPLYRSTVAATEQALTRQPGVIITKAFPPAVRDVSAAHPIGLFEVRGLSYRDPHNSYVFVSAYGDDRERLARYPAQRAAAERTARQASGGRVAAFLVGATPVNADVRTVEISGVRVIEGVAVVLSFLVLWLGLGTLGAAVLTLALSGSTILVTLGAIGVLSRVTTFDVFVLTAVSVVGLGIGIDYALLIVSRFREELAAAHGAADRTTAAGTAVATAGRTVVYSAMIVAVAAASLFAVKVSIFTELALATLLVIAVAVAASLTLLPAALSLRHGLLDAGPLPWRRGRPYEAAFADDGRWARWAGHLMRRPWPYLLAGTATLLLCAVPALHLRLGADLQRSVLAGTPSGTGLALLEADSFAGATGTLLIDVRHPRGAPAPDVTRLVAALERDPQVDAVAVGKERSAAVLLVVPREAPDRPRTAALVRRVRGEIVPSTVTDDSSRVLVGGVSALLVDAHDELVRKLWWVLTFVLASTLLILAAMMRSLLIPLKAVVMNLLTCASTLGLFVVTFQWGRGERVLGFHGDGIIQVYLPLLLFAIVFGVSTDYEVFLVRRVQEIYHRTGDNTASVAAGVQRTARPIFVAAAVLVAVSAALLPSPVVELKEFGFALLVAVVIDATIVRLVLVPAVMRVLGRWNWWWPRPLRTVLPRHPPVPDPVGTGPVRADR
ncbi:MMPL family transporter [Actinoallomurus bryophytorum]|uniref:RND superfamily putative drug exporter n=1 Tax=Actinoallomurus bryophytorum TaxID=1490222 RepID=A0A543CJ10_9ACTN|nr:MMPL family transporter [Actinoallomurus bryophytorum]TQL97075.1 RND superfamily putative drug exporter [Actinoallomurus bryophytorum]